MLEDLLARLRPHWRRDRALPRRIENLLRGDRRFGARDRRLYRELVYTAIRHLPWIEASLDTDPDAAVRAIAALAPDLPATRPFKEAFGASPPEAGGRLLPDWLESECPEVVLPTHAGALQRRSPLWLRLQADDPAPVLRELESRGWPWRESPLLPGAIEILAEADITKTEAYRNGLVEIQDLGSQMILEAAGIEAGGTWLDACAGAGGKSLQLARLLGAGGRVEAHDVRSAALVELERRAARAGLSGRIARQPAPRGPYDGVLVDAPCSGTGTWRRFPHLKWVTRPADIRACARRQAALLDRFAPLVRPGGRLIYATCSLCRAENEAVLSHFLETHPGFIPAPWRRTFRAEPRGPALLFWPDGHDGDGFFAASLENGRAGRA